MADRPITIIGCGPGSKGLLTADALEAADKADCLIGSQRLLELFPNGNEKISIGASVSLAISEIEKRIATKSIGLLVSGDPGLCSIAKPVLEKFGRLSCRVIPGISSIQLAFASIGIDWYGARIISAHAKDPNQDYKEFSGESKIAVLGGREESAKWVAGLAQFLNGKMKLIVCENLGLPSEKVSRVEADEIEKKEFASMAIFLLINKELIE